MPYYDRIKQLRKTLDSFRELYAGRTDYEIVLVEDVKNTEEMQQELADVSLEYEKLLGVLTPIYCHPGVYYNPAILYNHGVKNSIGDFVLITEPECLHTVDILSGMDEEFAKDPNCCVVCGCQSYNQQGQFHKWWQHSVYRDTRSPWCNGVSQKAYLDSGGIPEEFAEGYAFDDNALRAVLENHGVRFVLRDDLLVIHQWHFKHQVPNRNQLHEKNKKLFNQMFN
jgi:hypothetical protein